MYMYTCTYRVHEIVMGAISQNAKLCCLCMIKVHVGGCTEIGIDMTLQNNVQYTYLLD